MLWVLIGINALVYLAWQVALGDPAVMEIMRAHFLVSLEAVVHGRYWTLITNAFSHLDPSHLLFNMIGLFVFGRDVLAVIGGARFVHLYLAGGIVAALGHVGFSWLTGEPNPALGASGSVMALAVVFGALYPKRVLMVNFFIPVPAALAVVAFIALDVFGAFWGGSGIAHAAHLGGAAYGLAYYLVAIRR